RSEEALVEVRGERGEELALPRAPLGRPAHHDVELLGEPVAEELPPVEERLDHAERLGRRVRAVQDLESHPSARSAASSRRRPSSTATATVRSKISSSDQPASLTAWTSASVIVYARSRTLAR